MLGERLPRRAGAAVGADQPRRRRRAARRGDRGAGGAPGRRSDALLRGHQAPAQQLAVRADGRAARAGGANPAGDGLQRRFRRRARWPSRRSGPRFTGFRRRTSRPERCRRSSWQTSSSASRPRLNRIPAALGHLVSATLGVLHPAVGRLVQRQPDRQPVQDHARDRAGDLRAGRGRPALRAGQVPRAQGRRCRRRSAATRAWRSAGRSPPR